MKKILTVLALAALTVVAMAQDKIYLHSGKVIDGKVIKQEEFTIIYKYAGEDAEQTISKRAVGKIVYSSGREETVSDKIVINGEDDWEKVEILMDKGEVVGLVKKDEVTGKTSGYFSGYTSAAKGDKKSQMKMLKAAAALHCPFVYMTTDNATSGAGTFGKQGLKKGIAYNYE